MDRDRRHPAHGPGCSASGGTTTACCGGSPPARRPSSPCRRRATRTLLLVESLDDAHRAGALVRAQDLRRRFPRAARPAARTAIPGSGRAGSATPADEPRLEVLDRRAGVVDAVLEQVWRLPRGESDFVTVVIPEQFRRGRRCSSSARRTLELAPEVPAAAEPGVVVADVPAVAGRTGPPTEEAHRPVSSRASTPHRCAPSTTPRTLAHRGHPRRALRLQLRRRAATSAATGRITARAIPLEVDEAPYRDLGKPLLRYLRELTEEGDTTVLVLMPELVTRGWRARAPQPACALHQAPAPLRAQRDPRERSLPAAPLMRVSLDRVRDARHRARRLARRTAAVAYRSIVVPLLGRAETEHALDLACRLAADRRAHVILVAPLIVDQELPLNAQFEQETASSARAARAGRRDRACVRRRREGALRPDPRGRARPGARRGRDRPPGRARRRRRPGRVETGLSTRVPVRDRRPSSATHPAA